MEITLNGEIMIKKSFLVLLALMVFVACEEQNDEVTENTVPVKVFTANLDTISQFLRLTGSAEAENDAIVYAKISEKIDKIISKVGDKVKKKDIIAIQYNEILKHNIELAKAALKTAKSQNQLAQQDFQRIKKLFDQKAVSPQQFDQSKTQKQITEAALEQAQSQLAQAEENYQNSLIKAPFDGVVAVINFDVDQMVNTGQPVAQVINPKSMKAKLMVSGTDANKVKLDQLVEIEFPSIPGKIYKGKVVRINKALNPVNNSLEIEVRILNPDEKVKSGIFGKFNLELVTKSEAIIVPEAAVQQQTEVQIDRKTGEQKSVKKYFIFKIDNERAVLAEVKVGIRSEGKIEITDGLKTGDKLVVVGQNIVKDGDLVKIIE